jgi:peptidoglycan/xylan/chitin deacetylase (PgdA/CDA1 family)
MTGVNHNKTNRKIARTRKITGKIALLFLVLAFTLSAFFFFYMQPRYTVPVLMYHSIADDPASTLSVTPENFKKQINYLHKAGYSVISFDKLIEKIKTGKSFARNEVVITFDDGLEDNYIKAFPVLSSYDMPAIIFLETANIGAQDGYLTWDQIRVMAKNNIKFGGHTRTGAYLPSVKDDALIHEIAGSKADIENQLGLEVLYFCYPQGGFNNRVKEVVKNAGYKAAATTNRGFDMLNKDVYEINRIKVTDSDMTKPLNFKLKLSGYYNLFRKGKSPS